MSSTVPGAVPTTTSWNFVYILPGLLDALDNVVVVDIVVVLSAS